MTTPKPLGEEAVKLLPCPFCGEMPEVYPKRPGIEGDGFGQVRCESETCPANPVVNNAQWGDDFHGPETFKREAIAAWNRRPQPQGACVQVEGLRAAAVQGRGGLIRFLMERSSTEADADDFLALLAERDTLEEGWDLSRVEWAKLVQSEIDKRHAALLQRDAAMKALEPFARCGREFWHESRAEEAVHLHDFCGQLKPELTNLTVGDFQRARQALSDLKEMGE